MDQNKVCVGLGEILWDLLPRGKQLGGAPANFAYHCSQLGNRGIAASRIGRDSLGEEIVARLTEAQLSPDFLQLDEVHPTGTVDVNIDAAGQPQYTIVENVAWDFIEWNESMAALAHDTAAVCFGSLAQRNAASRQSILRFLDRCPDSALRIFDINLRQHYFDREVLAGGLERATIAKLNDEELPRVADAIGIARDAEETMARELLDRFKLKLVAVTRGARGSMLLNAETVSVHPGVSVKVVDTVGAGDAFVAAIAHHVLRGSPLDVANKAANRLGAYVASQPGAMPPIPADILNAVI